MLRAQPQQVAKTTKKMCYTVAAGSRIPQPCDRLAAIPTTHGALDILGHRTGNNQNSDDFAGTGVLPRGQRGGRFYIFARQAIIPRSRAPTFSMECFSASRSNCT